MAARPCRASYPSASPQSASDLKNSPTLREWLIRQGGAAPFRHYMEAALHDPVFGYYSRNITTVGRGGDFSTSASLSGMLARALASWLRQQRADSREKGICHLIEIGPGTGQLHRDLRRALGWRGRWGLHSHLVERSPELRRHQHRTMGLFARHISWHGHPAEALRAAGGRAFIFSNELVDAFPVTLLERGEGAWQEVWLELLPDGRLVETLRAPTVSPDTSLKAEDFADGQRIEVHASYREWLDEWLPIWKAGMMLTIDYGGTADQLYYRRPQGSLRAYRRHERLEGLGIYRDPGHCDLTADVNFTDLACWGRAQGLSHTSPETQADFLSRHARVQNAADAWLTDPAGPGGAFLFLQQKPGEGRPA